MGNHHHLFKVYSAALVVKKIKVIALNIDFWAHTFNIYDLFLLWYRDELIENSILPYLSDRFGDKTSNTVCFLYNKICWSIKTA